MQMQISNSFPRIGIVGCGRVGQVLGIAASRGNYPVTACASRSRGSAARLVAAITDCAVADTPADLAAACDWIFLTVPDDQVATVAASIPWGAHHLALHCSGALPADVLRTGDTTRARVAGFHPIQTLADLDSGLANLPGSAIGIEADDEIYEPLAAFARAIGATPLRLREGDRSLYHVGCVLASNFTVGLIALAIHLWETVGIDPHTARDALLPLLAGTARNLSHAEPADALTGPLVRGDSQTIARHLTALETEPDAQSVYMAMSRSLLGLVEASGRLSPPDCDIVRRILNEAVISDQTANRPVRGSEVAG